MPIEGVFLTVRSLSGRSITLLFFYISNVLSYLVSLSGVAAHCNTSAIRQEPGHSPRGTIRAQISLNLGRLVV